MSAVHDLWRLDRAAHHARLQPEVSSGLTYVSFYVHHSIVKPPLCWLSVWWDPDRGDLLRCLRSQRTLGGELSTKRLTIDEAVDWVNEGMPL